MQIKTDNVIFHNNVTIPSTGLELKVISGTLINIEFETVGSFSATFEAKANDPQVITTWKPITAANLATLDLSPTVTDKGYIYQIDLTGITALRVNLTSVSGNTSVYGMLVG